jgi:DNA polymerase III delta prime subunit
MDSLWLEKYRPKTLKDYLGNKDDIIEIKKWLLNFKNRKEKFLILYGSPGIGKTTIAHLIFNEYGYKVIEVNSSEQRSKKILSEKIKSITKKNILLKKNGEYMKSGLLLDELDGTVNNNEISAIAELYKIISSKDNNYPIICTCNSIKIKNIKLMFKISLLIELEIPDKKNILKLATKIIKEEKIKIDNKTLNKLTLNINDYRRLILNLYEYNLNNKKTIFYNNNLSHLNNNVNDIILYYYRNSVELKELKYYIYSNSNLFYYSLNTNYIKILELCYLFNLNGDQLINLIKYINNLFLSSNIFYYYMYNKNFWQIKEYYIYVGIFSILKVLKENLSFFDKKQKSKKIKNGYIKFDEYYNLNKNSLERYNIQKNIKKLHCDYKIDNIEQFYYYNDIILDKTKKKLKKDITYKDKLIEKINMFLIN